MPDIAGFSTNDAGSLLVTTDTTGARWDGGFYRSPAGELVVTTDPGDWSGGFMRKDGALCVTDQLGVWDAGYVRKDGMLSVSTEPGELYAGFYRKDGMLAVEGLAPPAVYMESFDTDDGGWIPFDADTLTRDTGSFQSAPASLKCVNPGTGGSGAVSAFFPVSGDVTGEIWVRSPDSTGTVTVSYAQVDASDNPVGVDTAGEGTATLSTTWKKVLFTGDKDGQPKGAVIVNGDAGSGKTIFVDSVKVMLA